MEAFNEMMRNIISMQQKTFGAMYENIKTPLGVMEDYEKFIDNSIKFHKAGIKYHESIIEMMESMKEITNIYKIKM